MTFDWAQIAYIGSPLLTPWWAAANTLCSSLVFLPLLLTQHVGMEEISGSSRKSH